MVQIFTNGTFLATLRTNFFCPSWPKKLFFFFIRRPLGRNFFSATLQTNFLHRAPRWLLVNPLRSLHVKSQTWKVANFLKIPDKKMIGFRVDSFNNHISRICGFIIEVQVCPLDMNRPLQRLNTHEYKSPSGLGLHMYGINWSAFNQ